MSAATSTHAQNNVDATQSERDVAAAQPVLPDELTDANALSIQIRAIALYPAPGGRIIFPATSGKSKDIDVEMLNLDSPRLSPSLEIDVSMKQWRVLANYTSFDASDRGTESETTRRVGDVPVAVGDQLVSSLSVDWGQVLVERTVLERPVGASAQFKLLAGAGIRFYDMSMSMDRLAGGRAQADPSFVEPIAGAELRFTYREAYTVRVAVDAGYSDWSDKATQSWGVSFESSAKIDDHFAAHFGYRILTFDLDEGKGSSAFEYRGSLAGLFVGVSCSF